MIAKRIIDGGVYDAPEGTAADDAETESDGE